MLDPLSEDDEGALTSLVTVGAGKTEAAIRNLPVLLDAARKAGREGAIYILIPRHDLSDARMIHGKYCREVVELRREFADDRRAFRELMRWAGEE